ncbi:MAG TPA: metallophosphoesterase family protein, partial [Thermoanaerobaculia bacterium]|nr:metallophosphoesterase family protein [Thermoanaerobaculia bacterium]
MSNDTPSDDTRNVATRVAALYDVHGNLPALEAVLAEMRREAVDCVVVGGDVVPGPMALEALRLLRALDVPTHFVRGNCESAVLAARRGDPLARLPAAVRETMRWTAEQLRSEDEQLLATWPLTIELDVRGLGRVLFCHATPRNDDEIFTRLTREEVLLPIFAPLGAGLVVCGHTHMPFDRMVGATRVVNAGSVGMPFGEPGADWLFLGPGVEPRHTAYDLEAAAARIRATSYPQAAEFADR